MSRPCQQLVAAAEWQGVVYERRCGASPATEYINGWYCAAHQPSVIYRDVVAPTPDPAASVAALAARNPGLVPVARPDYSVPVDPPEIAARDIRVYADHKKAVMAIMADANAIIAAQGWDAFAEIMATAVLCAMDSKTEYVIGVRVPGASPVIFGPYPTAGQAQKAISDGHVVAFVEGQQAWILPLVPNPRTSPIKVTDEELGKEKKPRRTRKKTSDSE